MPIRRGGKSGLGLGEVHAGQVVLLESAVEVRSLLPQVAQGPRAASEEASVPLT